MDKPKAAAMTPEVIASFSTRSVQGIPSLADVFVSAMRGKTAIVTGGATGLGYNIVNRLAEAGASVVIASRNPEKGEKAVREFRERGYEVCFCKADVTSVNDCYQVVDFTEKTYGKVDILVANAATWSNYAFVDMKEEAFSSVIDTDLKGEYFMAQAAARSMIRNKVHGKIVLISSAAHLGCDSAKIGMMTHYNAAKGAIVSLTKGIAKELKQYGICVNCVAPGGMLTSGAVTNGGETGRLYGMELLADRQAASKDTPLAMNPDSIALVVYAMCTSMSDFMFGETVDVNGGVQLSFQEKPWSYTLEGCVPGPQNENETSNNKM